MLHAPNATKSSDGEEDCEKVQNSAGRTMQYEKKARSTQALGATAEDPVIDIMAFPENVFACILQALPPEQLLNVSKVPLPCMCSNYLVLLGHWDRLITARSLTGLP